VKISSEGDDRGDDIPLFDTRADVSSTPSLLSISSLYMGLTFEDRYRSRRRLLIPPALATKCQFDNELSLLAAMNMVALLITNLVYFDYMLSCRQSEYRCYELTIIATKKKNSITAKKLENSLGIRESINGKGIMK
jgi:hypothetical protein